mgnify:FL=1
MGDLVNTVANVFGIGPASKQLKAADRAADISTAASREATDLQRQMYYEGVARQQPWLQAGQIALNKLVPEATNYQNFGMEQFKQDPGYAFRMSEGMKALENSAAARGGLLSGATMKGIQRYGQDMASQEYMNAFNRYQVEREARLNPLQSLAGVGQTTANALAAGGQGFANTVNQITLANAADRANLGLAAGNIRASQYNTAGRAIDDALETDWGGVASTMSGWFG